MILQGLPTGFNASIPYQPCSTAKLGHRLIFTGTVAPTRLYTSGVKGAHRLPTSKLKGVELVVQQS